MKTQNAFALKDFDKNKMISRFCSGYGEMKDIEILRATKSVRSLIDIKSAIDIYANKILNHQNRIIRYSLNVIKSKKISQSNIIARLERVAELSNKYDIIVVSLAYLKEQITNLIEKARENFYREVFSKRLKQARREAGLTQVQLANKLGITQSGYSSYENGGREPTLATLANLSKILQRPIDWLVGIA